MLSKKSFLLRLLITLPLLIAAILGWGIVHKLDLEDRSQTLVLDVLEQVFLSGDIAAMLDAAHTDLRSQMPDQAWQNYLDVLGVLGELQVLESVTGQTQVPLIPWFGPTPTASYEVNLAFANSPAKALMELIHEDNQWLFTSWIISSNLTDE